MAIDAAESRQDLRSQTDIPGNAVRPRATGGGRRGVPDGFYARHGKRALDLVGASVLLIAFLPLLLMIIVLMMTQRGPIMFGHQRVGRSGKEFRCLKFRTMVVDAEERLQSLLARDVRARKEWQLNHKLEDDPRITGTGQFLRRTSLDELPQLVNVLRGEMSLVGPRPVTRAELQRYGDASASYLALRPGLTGSWQVSGRNDITYPARVAMDDRYARSFSLTGDVGLLLRTVGVVLGATGK